MSEKRDVLHSNRGIGFLVTQVSHSITQCFNRAFEQYDITFPQSRVMAYLIRQQDKGDVNQRDLESALGIKASSISSLVRNLENKGFVECKRRAADARNKSITLTEKGLAVQQQLDGLCIEIEEALTAGISEAQIDSLADLLQKVSSNIEQK
ncbi:MAG: winged helix-turn-helix transcriptional regulator [Ruminococcaceae bacterium]|nr:winged helix-turn-helix transcriptional regulator [Oscillospiraceae bacterium]